MLDTIVAIASGLINQPVSIIRISGIDAFEIVSKVFSGKKGNKNEITYGFIKDNDEIIDEVLVSWFYNPSSFTGEDVVEINAHGGVVVTNKILRLILSNGARMAEPGEFSRRAFHNGKMDLVKAESIHQLIFAATEEQRKLAIKGFDGETSSLIKSLREKLLFLIATCETNIDYPEYDDIEELTTDILLPRLKSLVTEYKSIIESSYRARIVNEGLNVAIIGKPNAGKSSLLNALLDEDKAIVSSIEGTTRDVVEGKVKIGQILLNLKDTAGIRNAQDEIEEIGVKKSFEIASKADLIIHLIDQRGKDEYPTLDGSKIIEVYNKSDLHVYDDSKVKISAKDGNIKELISAIKNKYTEIDLNDNKIISNQRQLSLIEKSNQYLIDCINSLESGLTPDVVIVDLRMAWEHLAEITGEGGNEKLLDEMFSKFCLGK